MPADAPMPAASSPCAVVHECGGCPLYAETAAGEERYKRELVRSALASALPNGPVPEISWVASPSRIAYRNRIRMRIEETGRITFFNPRKEAGCVALEPDLRAHVAKLAKFTAQRPSLSAFTHLEVRTADSRGHPSVCFARRPGRSISGDVPAALEELSCSFIVSAGDEESPFDVPLQRFHLLGSTYVDVPVGTFMQVNTRVNRLLVEHVVRRASRPALSTFVDLYSGSGNFALALAARGLRGFAVESCSASVLALKRAARAQRLEVTAEFGDSITQTRAWLAGGRRFDVVVVDAPRAGLRNGHEDVARLARREIVLCSCNPATFVRDARRIAARGFRLERVTAFDMFPGTLHVEVLGFLTRSAL